MTRTFRPPYIDRIPSFGRVPKHTIPATYAEIIISVAGYILCGLRCPVVFTPLLVKQFNFPRTFFIFRREGTTCEPYPWAPCWYYGTVHDPSIAEDNARCEFARPIRFREPPHLSSPSNNWAPPLSRYRTKSQHIIIQFVVLRNSLTLPATVPSVH